MASSVYVCFKCKKIQRRDKQEASGICPKCGKAMILTHGDIPTPKLKDDAGWKTWKEKVQKHYAQLGRKI